jgi:hypothetical protein
MNSAAPKFFVGDAVKINASWHPAHGRVGTVAPPPDVLRGGQYGTWVGHIRDDKGSVVYWVTFDPWPLTGCEGRGGEFDEASLERI